MTEYQSLKVPELKKLLNERGLPQTGNKADLIARLQENDKAKEAVAPGNFCPSSPPFPSPPYSIAAQSPWHSSRSITPGSSLHLCFSVLGVLSCGDRSGPGPFLETCHHPTRRICTHNDSKTVEASKPSGGDDDLIDYEEDDVPKPAPAAAASKAETAAPAKPTAATPAAVKEAPKPAQSAPPATEEKETVEAPTTESAVAAEAPETEQPAGAAAEEDAKYTQNLAPTNPQSEAEKRAARALRFGTAVKETAESDKKPDVDDELRKQQERAQKFGLSNDQVASLDSALPDRPAQRKRGRGREEENGSGDRANKRRPDGPAPRDGQRNGQRNGGGGGGRHNNRRGGGGRDNQSQQERRGDAPARKTNSMRDDPNERKRMEERAKRFGA
jgi:SAP domain-containing ribonucleoprotein